MSKIHKSYFINWEFNYLSICNAWIEKCYKYVDFLHLNKSTQDFLVYVELGRNSLTIQIQTHIIIYVKTLWSNFKGRKETTIPDLLYRLDDIKEEIKLSFDMSKIF